MREADSDALWAEAFHHTRGIKSKGAAVTEWLNNFLASLIQVFQIRTSFLEFICYTAVIHDTFICKYKNKLPELNISDQGLGNILDCTHQYFSILGDDLTLFKNKRLPSFVFFLVAPFTFVL